jgi:DNA-binding MarR family transcriptional regulator
MSDLDSLSSGFGKLFLRTHRLLDRRMTETGTSFARTKILICIERGSGDRAADIASYLGIAPRTVTEALDGLERDGLIRREPDPLDRRVKRLSLTPEGGEAVRATEPVRKRLIEEVFGTLDATDREELARLIAKLTRALDAVERD